MFQLIAQQQPSGNLLGAFAPLLLVFVAMYFLFIRPQQKRARERNAMLADLEVGDDVMTQAGILGTIVDIDEEEGVLLVEIAPGTTVRVVRGGIAQRVSADEEAGDEGSG